MRGSRQGSRIRRWLVGLSTLALLGGSSLISAASVAAGDPNDMVLRWNGFAVNALSNPLPTAVPTPAIPGANLPPPVASIHLAMVQGAVYDAVNAIDGGHQPYLTGLSAPSTASKAAAAATAAYEVLIAFQRPAPPPATGLVPVLPAAVLASLAVSYTDSLADVPAVTDAEIQAKADGISIGHDAATAMRSLRGGDGRFRSFLFPVSTPLQLGQWRPEPYPSGPNDPNAWVARVTPFTLTSPAQFRTAGPFALSSLEYAADFNEVKALGGVVAPDRTQAQADLARFYVVNPLPMLNRTLRAVAADQGLSLTEDARLFVMSSMSSADALINCWDDKAYWNFWRPITAIREAADDNNPDTDAVAGWLPYISTLPAAITPPYPDHPSGFNCFTAAMMHTAETYFRGDKIDTITLTGPTGATMTYKKFTAVMKDTIDARIYLGIHSRKPDVDGAWLGKKVASWVDQHYFGPAD